MKIVTRFAAVIVCLLSIPRIARCDALFGFGQGGYYNLGDGKNHNTTTASPSPTLSTGVSGVSTGSYFGIAIQNGAAFGFGENNYGQAGLGSMTVSAIQTPTAIPQLSGNVSAVASGYYSSLAIQNGAVFSWGLNGFGELGLGNTTSQASPQPIPSLSSGVTQIAGGSGSNSEFSLALMGGTVYSFGYNGFGQLGNGNMADQHSPVPVTALGNTVTAIAASGFGGMAIKGGALYTWGLNNWGQLGNGMTGNGQTIQSDVPVAANILTSGVTAIAGGYWSNFAVKGGQVYAWGYNGDGELGMGNTTSLTNPTLVPGLPGTIIAVGTDAEDTYALSSDGSIWDWGSNGFGELGLGDQNQRLSPAHLLPPAGYRFTSITGDTWTALATAAPVPEPTLLASLALLPLLVLRRRRAS